MKFCLSLGIVTFGLFLTSSVKAATLTSTQTNNTVVIQWNNAALQAIRDTRSSPPVTARALAIVHTSIYDAWSAYDPVAISTTLSPINGTALSNCPQVQNYNIDGKGAYPSDNTGVHEITNKPSDMGRFKAPTLRNITLTAPYMHDGSIATLSEAIEHYAAGGRTIQTGQYAGVGSENRFKSTFVKGFQLSESEKQDLLAFLQSLTDKTFIKNPAFSDPNSPKFK